MQQPLVSVIVPLFNEEANVPYLYGNLVDLKKRLEREQAADGGFPAVSVRAGMSATDATAAVSTRSVTSVPTEATAATASSAVSASSWKNPRVRGLRKVGSKTGVTR